MCQREKEHGYISFELVWSIQLQRKCQPLTNNAEVVVLVRHMCINNRKNK